MWMNNTLKSLAYDGSTEWETFIHRFRLVSDQMGLRDPERAEFLVSTLQGDAFKAIMYAQRAKGELGFHEICSRLESRYGGDFSTPAAAWMKLDQAFQQRNESLFQWSDRLNRIGGRRGSIKGPGGPHVADFGKSSTGFVGTGADPRGDSGRAKE